MSGIHLITSGPDLGSKTQSFTDLLRHLGNDLESIQTFTDLEKLMKSLSGYLKDKSFNTAQKYELKRLRQKGYDLRRIFKQSSELESSDVSDTSPDIFQMSRSLTDEPQNLISVPDEKIVEEEIQTQKKEDEVMVVQKLAFKEEYLHSETARLHPIDGVKKVRLEIDGERIARAFPRFMMLSLSCLLVGWFLWKQSVELYAASGFDNAEIVAFGGILMVLGFASFHAAYRSKLALLCCLYAGAYETYFITSGTVADELHSKASSSNIVEKNNWYKEKIERAKTEYNEQKARYENPEGKVYQNLWFKKKHLDPAWKVYSSAQVELEGYQRTVKESIVKFDHTGWLKIFFRLGLVFLFMLLVHRFVHFQSRGLVSIS